MLSGWCEGPYSRQLELPPRGPQGDRDRGGEGDRGQHGVLNSKGQGGGYLSAEFFFLGGRGAGGGGLWCARWCTGVAGAHT